MKRLGIFASKKEVEHVKKIMLTVAGQYSNGDLPSPEKEVGALAIRYGLDLATGEFIAKE